MSNIDPFQSPKVIEKDDFKVNNATGYRDGGYFIASKDFIAPKVCVVSGQSDEKNLVPNKVYMKPELVDSTVTIARLILALLGFAALFGFFLLDIETPLMFLLIVICYLVWMSLSDLVIKSITPSITVFCLSKVKKKQLFRKMISLGTLLIGFILIIGTDYIENPLWMTILGAGFIIIYTFTVEKPMLESVYREGDYERFKGAHPNFLNALPTGSEFHSGEKRA